MKKQSNKELGCTLPGEPHDSGRARVSQNGSLAGENALSNWIRARRNMGCKIETQPMMTSKILYAELTMSS